jgi:hypothetical protein
MLNVPCTFLVYRCSHRQISDSINSFIKLTKRILKHVQLIFLKEKIKRLALHMFLR